MKKIFRIFCFSFMTAILFSSCAHHTKKAGSCTCESKETCTCEKKEGKSCGCSGN